MREKTRSVGQRFGYASDHFKDSRNEKIKKEYGPYFYSCLIYFFPSFKHMHLQTDRHRSVTQKSNINMIYKKRSDEWPNVFSKRKNKSRCSKTNLTMTQSQMMKKPYLINIIHRLIICYLETDVHLLKNELPKLCVSQTVTSRKK